ncbi:1-acyl-sn-glycerol-3-phosphate acyltransferase [Membranihabitans maritimus]|uniref:1-acyl-sn-glycerol-3-phosphate acyltransferase n=1 Tax=Membranihabitans maritimus TaxID=2904244 RepID=UPI001F030C63|nr:1-acyl-sn-glycerol-3-phosphate acyltransferase [Membranihabitans maritimus]
MKENKKIYKHIKPDLTDWPIFEISEKRPLFVDRLVNHTYKKLHYKYKADFEDLLEKTIYQERIRIKRNPWRVDPPNDEAYWNRMKSRFGKSKRYKSKKKLREFERKSVYRIIQKYSEEIVGSFVPKTFLFARKFLTALFNILLGENLLKKSWKIWGKKEELYNALKVYGNIDKVRSLAEKGTIILVPTHFSNLDSILIGYVVDTKLGIPAFSYGAGLNLYNFGPAAYYMNRLGAYRVDRRKKNPIYLETLKAMSTLSIKSGVNNLFFPGGTRSRSGRSEEKLKLGLLNSITEAQRDICINDGDQKVYIVPLILDYHFVLEAKSLIRQHLTIQGREKYTSIKDLGKSKRKIFKFIWEFYTKSSEIVCSFGEPMDFIGNQVDEEGRSIDKNGNLIDIKDYFASDNELDTDVQRESEYTKLLANRIIERYKRDNVILSSHMIAYLAFEIFMKYYSNLDVYGLLKLPLSDFFIPRDFFIEKMEVFKDLLRLMEAEGALRLSSQFDGTSEEILMNGLSNIGLYHSRKPLKLSKDGMIVSDDLELLFYYHNRIDNYNFKNIFTENDRKRFQEIFTEEE